MYSLKMVFMIANFLFLTSAVWSMVLHQNCQNDSDCIYPNTYCYSSGKCVSCTNCVLYHRKNSSTCAKDKNQCGDCLPGMKTESNIDGTFSCLSSTTSTPSTQEPVEEKHYYTRIYIIITSAIGIPAIIILLCLYIRVKCKTSNVVACVTIYKYLRICPCSMTSQDSPPSYTEKSPSAPPFEEQPQQPDRPLTQTIHQIIENAPNQNANPFGNPLYIKGGTLGSDPVDDDENESTENEALINNNNNINNSNDNSSNNVILHPDDEETQPSTWTPIPETETRSINNGPTTFLNSISLQELTISQPNPDALHHHHQSPSPTIRSNSQPSIQFDIRQEPQPENSPPLNAQQINLIAHIGPVNINLVSQ